MLLYKEAALVKSILITDSVQKKYYLDLAVGCRQQDSIAVLGCMMVLRLMFLFQRVNEHHLNAPAFPVCHVVAFARFGLSRLPDVSACLLLPPACMLRGACLGL